MDRTVYQQQYDFELEQRNVITSSTNTPVVSITVIGSALSSMVLTFPYKNNVITSFFLAFVALALISSIVALVQIFKSVIGYSYQKIPSASALSTHHRALYKWHEQNGTALVHLDSEVEKDFDEFLKSRLSEASDHNGGNNIKRGNYIHNATVSIAIALGFMVLCSPFFIYAKSTNEANPYQVKIVQPISLISEVKNMAQNENGSDSGAQTTSSTSSKPAAPAQQPVAPAQTTQAKPAGPPNVVFKGSVSTVGKIMNTPTDRTISQTENKK